MNPSSIPAPGPNGPWRVLLLSRDPDGPFWAIATVVLPEDTRPADLNLAGRYQNWPQVCAWTATRLGQQVELEPMFDPLLWAIRPRRNPRGA